MTNYRIQKQSKLAHDDRGGTLVSYALVAGLIAVVGIGAVTYLSYSAEDGVQKLADKAGSKATIQGEASLGGEIAESTAIMGGAELPFQFGAPLFSLPPLKKGKKKNEPEQERSVREEVCPGGKCGGKDACFVAGTLVLTPSGYRKIEDLRVGDEVLSIAEDSPWATADAEAQLDAADDSEIQTTPRPPSAAEASALGDP